MTEKECPKCGSVDIDEADGYYETYLVCQTCGHEFKEGTEEQ